MSDNEFTGGGNSYIENTQLEKKGGDPTQKEIQDVTKVDDIVDECKKGANTTVDRCMDNALAEQVVDASGIKTTGNLDNDTKTAIKEVNKKGCDGTEECKNSETEALKKLASSIDTKIIEKNLHRYRSNGSSGAGLSGKDNRKSWLSNTDIDITIMADEQKHWNTNPSTKYYHVDFHMAGFMDHNPCDAAKDAMDDAGGCPTKLYNLSSTFKQSVIDKGYKYLGCVLNTDTYDGGGKHWVTLFVDIGNKTFEYFDSVGPENDNSNNNKSERMVEICEWMEKTKAHLVESGEHGWKIAPFNKARHQRDNYDCGLFACFYIIQRIGNGTPEKPGVPYDAFHVDSELNDNLMAELRNKYFSRIDPKQILKK
jgi:hypothetical protein